MGILDSIYKILPVKGFRQLSKKYYQILEFIYSPLPEAEFRKLLTDKLMINSGMTIFVHSSIDKLNIGFPVYNVLKILLEVVGPEGTLLFPAWHYMGRAEDYIKNPKSVFNVKRSPTVLGLLPELARRHKKAYRSLHPITSVVAIGKHAKDLVSEHHKDIYPQGEKSPFYKMINLDARIIGLGEKIVSLSFVHCVEDKLKNQFPVKTLCDEVYEGQVINFEKEKLSIKTKVPHSRIGNRDIVGYFNRNISADVCKQFKFKGANYFSCDANKLFHRMEELAKKSETIYTIR